MPTVLRVDGFVVRVHGPPREHPPPHVHVEHGPDGLVVVRLGTPERPPMVWAAYGMSDAEIVCAFRLVEAHHEQLEREWRRIHGKAGRIG